MIVRTSAIAYSIVCIFFIYFLATGCKSYDQKLKELPGASKDFFQPDDNLAKCLFDGKVFPYLYSHYSIIPCLGDLHFDDVSASEN